MGKEMELLLAVARILEPLHPALTPLIDEIDPPAEVEQPAEAPAPETDAPAEVEQPAASDEQPQE